MLAPHTELWEWDKQSSPRTPCGAFTSVFSSSFLSFRQFFSTCLMDYAEEEELPIVQCAQRAEASIAISPSLVFQRGFLQNQITTSWKYHRPEHICFHKMDFEILQRNEKLLRPRSTKRKKRSLKKIVLSLARSLSVKIKTFVRRRHLQC